MAVARTLSKRFRDVGIREYAFAEWFPAAVGLVTVRTLRKHVDTHLDSVPSGHEVANELTGFIHVLEEAEKRGIRWHLAVDY